MTAALQTYIGEVDKDPAAIVDYGINWTNWPLPVGVTLSSATWTATPSSLTVVSSALANANKQANVRTSGGVVGQVYTLTCHAVLSDGQEDARSIKVTCVNR